MNRIKSIIFLFFTVLASQVALRANAEEIILNPDTKNMAWVYGQVGKNTIEHFYEGVNAFYVRSLNDRINVMGGLELNSKKDGFGGVLAELSYKLPVRWFDLVFSGRGVYNRYGKYDCNEYLFRLAVNAQSSHFDVLFGNSFLGYSQFGSSVFEPITWSVGFAAYLKNRKKCNWNLGLFLKNYDYFIYENWNINFGVRGYFSLTPKVRLTGELLVRPAGNINQLAQKFDTSVKIGATYRW